MHRKRITWFSVPQLGLSLPPLLMGRSLQSVLVGGLLNALVGIGFAVVAGV